MHIDVKRLGNTMVISPKGNIDYVTAPELDELISNIADDIESIELDMSDVPYIASAGLRVRNEKTKRVMEIFHLFGVEDPAQLPVEDPTA